jgi:DNA-binding response OmpR family regulator
MTRVAEPEHDSGTLQFGNLTIDPAGLAVFVDGRVLRLTYSEVLLLETLARQPFRVLDRSALRDALVAAHSREVPESADLRLIDRHIARLRRKLRDAGCDCIETMRFAGYRFVPCDAGATAVQSLHLYRA